MYSGMFEVLSPKKSLQVWEKDKSPPLEHMQRSKREEPGVQRSEGPLSACHTRPERPMETSLFG